MARIFYRKANFPAKALLFQIFQWKWSFWVLTRQFLWCEGHLSIRRLSNYWRFMFFKFIFSKNCYSSVYFCSASRFITMGWEVFIQQVHFTGTLPIKSRITGSSPFLGLKPGEILEYNSHILRLVFSIRREVSQLNNLFLYFRDYWFFAHF